LLVGLPAVLAFLGVPSSQSLLLRMASFALLLLGILVGLAMLYRYGPCRQAPRWHWVTPGSLVATMLWIAASALFSWYVATFSTYDATYGPLGTVVGIMMWFYVTVYAVLLGAELNAELELQTVRDSTSGPPKPLGRRGAYVADHVAED
jgi:membrane protein